MDQIKEESIGMIHNLQVQVKEDADHHVQLEGGGLEQTEATDSKDLTYTAPDDSGEAQTSGGAASRSNKAPAKQSAAKAKAQRQQQKTQTVNANKKRGSFGQEI